MLLRLEKKNRQNILQPVLQPNILTSAHQHYTHHSPSNGIRGKIFLMVGTKKFTKIFFVHGKNRKMLVVGVVFNGIADHVVHVVGTFPPRQRNATRRVANKDAGS